MFVDSSHISPPARCWGIATECVYVGWMRCRRFSQLQAVFRSSRVVPNMDGVSSRRPDGSLPPRDNPHRRQPGGTLFHQALRVPCRVVLCWLMVVALILGVTILRPQTTPFGFQVPISHRFTTLFMTIATLDYWRDYDCDMPRDCLRRFSSIG